MKRAIIFDCSFSIKNIFSYKRRFLSKKTSKICNFSFYDKILASIYLKSLTKPILIIKMIIRGEYGVV